MNYCSLEDAWGRDNRMCSQYKNYMDDKNNKNNIEPDIKKNQTINDIQPDSLLNLNENIEQFSNVSDSSKLKELFVNAPYQSSPQVQISHKPQHKVQQNISNQYDNHFDNHFDELNDCDNFLKHVRNCRKCHNKVKNYFKPKLVENFQDIIEDNKDTIVLILIGISILLFFNLINNMTKSN